jgi:hypothetical protein
MTRLIGGSKKQKYYVHRAGIQCGRHRHQVPRHLLEAEFLGLIRQLSVDTELMDSLLTFAAEMHPSTTDAADVETRRAAAIAKCRRKLEAAKNLYADGEITREEYLKRKDQNDREIAHWRAYTTHTQHIVTEITMCIDAVGKLSRLWDDSSNEERNRMAHALFDYVAYDLDKHRIVDFKLKPWMDQFLVLRAATAESLAKYGKCDPGRIRTYDTPLKRRVLCH